MESKIFTTVAYLVVGLYIAILPLTLKALKVNGSDFYARIFYRPYISLPFIGAASLWLLWVDAVHDHRLIYCWVLVAALAALMGRPPLWRVWFIGALAGFVLSSAMPWWRYGLGYVPIPRRLVESYGAIGFVTVCLLMRELKISTLESNNLNFRRVAFILFIPAAFYLSFNTGIIKEATFWHHWGAYVGPAELLLSGAHVLHDIPLQYGLGPTVLVATACHYDCWAGMYWVTGITTFLAALLVFCTALSFLLRSRLSVLMLPVITVFACFFWTSYGGDFSSPIVYPSVFGLRFLPVIVLVAALNHAELSVRYKPYWKPIGHCLWAIGALWSPESLFAVSFVWWPYYCWRYVEDKSHPGIFLPFATALLRLAGVAVLVLALFLAVYWVCYRDLPSVTAWAGYMLYPPGPMPINPRGPVWWYGMILLMGLAVVIRLYRDGGDAVAFRRCFLMVLLGYANLSYCMGRSHDNNFLNLTPYALLILAAIFALRGPAGFNAVAVAMMASIIAWSPVLGWNLWQKVYEDGLAFDFAPGSLSGSFKDFSARSVGDQSVIDAVKNFRKDNDRVTVLDQSYDVFETGPDTAWDAFHATANYVYFPSQWRRRFLGDTAARLQRSGWLLIDKKFIPDWIDDYKAVYQVDDERDFGTYHAYHFVPKAGD